MIATMEQHKMWTESIVSVAPQEAQPHYDQQSDGKLCHVCRRNHLRSGTFWFLYINGMMLGVIGAACHQYGMSEMLWSFVAPHGSLELPAIIIAGAAGFRIGHAMLFPGGYRWKESVAKGWHRGHPAGRGRNSHAGDRGNSGGILFSISCAGLAEVYSRRASLYAAAHVALPPGKHRAASTKLRSRSPRQNARSGCTNSLETGHDFSRAAKGA